MRQQASLVITVASIVVAATIMLLTSHILGYARLDAAHQPDEPCWYDNDLPRCQ